MKMHLTTEDIDMLTDVKKRRLTEIWKPEKYDLAAAFICKDADNEEYDVYEFVIEDVLLDNYMHIYLNDIKAPVADLGEENEAAPEEELEEADEEQPEEELEMEYIRPSCFNKEECVPLLNIGQMIEILKRHNYGEGDFYMTVGTAEVGIELGKNAANFDMFSSNYEQKELCDVLWELVKTIL